MPEGSSSHRHETAKAHTSHRTETAAAKRQAAIEQEPLISFEELRQALTDQVEAVQHHFRVKHRHLLKWAGKHGYTLDFLQTATGQAVVAGGLMASLLVSAPQQIAHGPMGMSPTMDNQQQLDQQLQDAYQARKKYQMTVLASAQHQAEEQTKMKEQLLQLSQQHSMTTDVAVQDQVAQLTTQLTGVPAVASLEGYRLNTSVGRIGAEQHLKRYPGDAIQQHEFQASGFAPGLGAYGYFAPSAAAMTPEIVAREKYYVAVQTFLSPNWSGNVHNTYAWFKYRKVIVYHPMTGQAVVAVVGDAGPGKSTGKAFGGSPEVMAHLKASDGRGSPSVVLLFVNDPDNKIPLGPVNFKVEASQ